MTKVASFEKLALPLAAAGVFAADQMLGAFMNANRRDIPEFLAEGDRSADETLIVLPGCQTDPYMLSNAFKQHAGERRIITTAYAEHGFHEEAVYEGLADEITRRRIEKPDFFCQSMGGMVLQGFVPYAVETGLVERMGGFGTITFDASPFDYTDVLSGSQHLLDTASAPIIRTSFGLDYLKRRIYRHIAGKMSAGAHLDTIYSEGQFMQQFHPAQPLPDVMDMNYYLQGIADHVVNTDTASPHYEAILPTGKFKALRDTLRADGDHTAPEESLSAIVSLSGGIILPSFVVIEDSPVLDLPPTLALPEQSQSHQAFAA